MHHLKNSRFSCQTGATTIIFTTKHPSLLVSERCKVCDVSIITRTKKSKMNVEKKRDNLATQFHAANKNFHFYSFQCRLFGNCTTYKKSRGISKTKNEKKIKFCGSDLGDSNYFHDDIQNEFRSVAKSVMCQSSSGVETFCLLFS